MFCHVLMLVGKTHLSMGRTYKLHTERPCLAWESNPEATVLTTAPPCSHCNGIWLMWGAGACVLTAPLCVNTSQWLMVRCQSCSVSVTPSIMHAAQDNWYSDKMNAPGLLLGLNQLFTFCYLLHLSRWTLIIPQGIRSFSLRAAVCPQIR